MSGESSAGDAVPAAAPGGDRGDWQPRRSRRSRRDRTTSVEEAVLEATERLLEGASLQDIDVKHIIDEAGISRTTFYLYFSSKLDVISTLLDRVSQELWAEVGMWATNKQLAPAERIKAGIVAAAAVWDRHRAIYNGAAASWSTDPELSEAWRLVLDGWATVVARSIQHDIDAGHARPNGDLTTLVTALTWSSAHLFHIGSSGVNPALAGMEAAVDALQRMWEACFFSSDR